MKYIGQRICGLALGLATAVPAIAVEPADYQVHGFAAQGFAYSDGNNIIGDSTEGNEQYFELGVNGTVLFGDRLRLSAQELVRRSGALDDGDLRLDYGFADVQVVGGGALEAGLRAGRVKNDFGLFNETRDVIFARPGILMPSVYFDTQGTRSLLFSSDGAQAYAGWSHGSQYTTFSVSRAADFEASEDERKVFFAGAIAGGTLEFQGLTFARLLNDWHGGAFKLGLSYASAGLAYTPGPTDPPVSGDIDIDLYVLSARYNAERFSLTAEYQLTESEGAFGAPVNNSSDGAYVQADYRLAPEWAAAARLDASYSNRHDRGGEQCTDNGAPADEHRCYTLDTMVGLNWQPDRHWGVWGEFHLFDGTSIVPTIENLGRTKEPHWNLFVLMAAYRF